MNRVSYKAAQAMPLSERPNCARLSKLFAQPVLALDPSVSLGPESAMESDYSHTEPRRNICLNRSQ